MNDAVYKLTQERLEIYLRMLDPTKRSMFEQGISTFSIAAKIFLCDLNGAIVSEL